MLYRGREEDNASRRLVCRIVNAPAGEEAGSLEAIFREILLFQHPVEFWNELGERGACLFVRRMLEELTPPPPPPPCPPPMHPPTKQQSVLVVQVFQALLALMAGSDANKNYFAKESCHSLVRAAHLHHKDPDALAYGLAIVPQLCRGCPWARGNVAAFSTDDLSKTILYAFYNYPKDPDVVLNGLLAMEIQDDACWAAHYLPDPKMALGVCQLMKWHPADRELQLAASRVLERLLSGQKGTIDLLDRRLIDRTLKELRQTYAHDADVRGRFQRVCRRLHVN